MQGKQKGAVGSAPLIEEAILSEGLVAILRQIPLTEIDPVVHSLLSAGVRIVEVALNSPDALDILQHLRRYDTEVIIGAGTARDRQTAELALRGGARFLMAPTNEPFLIPLCHDYDALPIPGTFSPTEISTACRNGARVVKVFPAAVLGPRYFSSVLATLGETKLIAVGGVNVGNISTFVKAGAAAVGVGKNLVDPELVRKDRYTEIEERAKRYLEALHGARNR